MNGLDTKRIDRNRVVTSVFESERTGLRRMCRSLKRWINRVRKIMEYIDVTEASKVYGRSE